MTPLSSDLQEILDNVHTMGMSDQLLGVKPHYYNKTLEKVAQALEALIQSRERAARIDEHDFIANLLIKSGGSITPRSAGDWLKQELAIHRATLSNNEGDNHERS